MLLKRSVVLAGEKPFGYVNFIRFGNTLGAKLRLNEKKKGVLALSVNGERQFFDIDGDKQEFDLNLPFDSNSVLGAVLANENGEVFAWGGKKENLRSLERAFRQWREDTAIVKANAQVMEAQEAVPETPAVVEEQVEAESAQEIAETEEELNKEENAESTMPERDANLESDSVTRKGIAGSGMDDISRKNPFEVPLNENFYAGIRARLEEALTVNPREEDLERLIPESQWVKVFYEGDDYYVIGEIRENGAPHLVGYGVPGMADVVPPEEVRDVTDFLPVAEGKGYWLLFQSAENGEILPN